MSSMPYTLFRVMGRAGARRLPAAAAPGESRARLAALFVVACCGGMLPIANMAMIGSAYLALSGDFNTDLINLSTMVLGCLMMMSLTPPLVNYIHRALGLRLALLAALILLAVAGTGAALSATLPGLCFCYAFMGLGGCLLVALASRIIVFTAPHRLHRPLLVAWLLCIGFSSSASPLIGGLLVDYFTWRSLFFLSPLVAALCMPVILFLVPDAKLPQLPKLDKLSFAFLLILAPCALFSVCQGQTLGWDSTIIQVLLFISGAALFLFLISCISAPVPLLAIRNFGFRGVLPALVLAVVLVTVHVGIRVEVILYARYLLGYTPAQIGMLFFLPLCCYMAMLFPAARILSATGLLKALTLSGLVLMGIAGLLLSRLDANAGRGAIIFALCIDHVGYVLADIAIIPLILRNIPPEKQPATLPAVSSFRCFTITAAIGTLATLNVQLKHYYSARLASQVTELSSPAMSAISHWERFFRAGGAGAAQAKHNALALVEASVKKQAAIFTFDHLFLFFTLLAALGAICLLFCRRHSVSRYCRVVGTTFRYRTRSLRRRIFPPSGWRSRAARVHFLPLPLMFALLASSLTGCTLGPDYLRPESDLPGQSGTPPGDLFMTDRWWEIFRDPALNTLVEQSLSRNLDLEQAMARVDAARARAGMAFADRLPSVDVGGVAGTRQMTYGEQRTHHYESRRQESYAVLPALSFELDLWGRYRRLDEAARARLLAAEAGRDTVRLALTAEIARTYFQLRTLQERRRLAADMIAAYDQTCKVYETRYRLGQSPETTLRRFEAERAKTRVMLLRLDQEQTHAEGMLAVLAGFSPREIIEVEHRSPAGVPAFAAIPLPPDIPSGLPSDLLRRRPDVRAAEGRLRATNALIGAQMASFFPSISLTGNAGYSTTEFEDLFLGTSGVWSLAGRVNLPLFNGGKLRSGLREKEALYAEARAAYLKSVQNAFRETRDALADNRISREVFTASTDQVRKLTRSHDIMGKQYDAGLSSVMDLLDVRRQLLAAQQECAEAFRRELESVVLLCKAMGGGWTEESGFPEQRWP